MDGTILGQGTFVVPATIVNQIIQVPSAADWVRVMNYTQYGTAPTGATNAGIEFFWQRGMPNGSAMVKYYVNGQGANASAISGDLITSGGFSIWDSSAQQAGSAPIFGNPVAVTAVTNATRPVLSTGSTAGVSVGSVVRLSQTAQTDVNGIDFVVGAVTLNTSITLLTASNVLATAPGAIGGANGFYRIVNYPALYYPARKTVVNITQAANAQVSTALEHSLTVGQSVRFSIPSVSGMVQLNPSSSNQYLYATVLSVVDAYNITIDVNTTSFTAFTWPTIAQQPSAFPTMEPIGENSSVALAANNSLYPQYQGLNVFNANNGVFADATINTGYYGMILGTGGIGSILAGATKITGPAGTAASDVMYWVSGKADFGGL